MPRPVNVALAAAPMGCQESVHQTFEAAPGANHFRRVSPMHTTIPLILPFKISPIYICKCKRPAGSRRCRIRSMPASDAPLRSVDDDAANATPDLLTDSEVL
ncbi:hypothetical protein ColLi_00185 [Colletotrichum liriopes]|uniref:Uncharacterized protein n=1 Tax=Colletotrichum liriopes TaxID=708192 RepID=A0AA37GAY7_9PEZI|nr:hypothetical protein ColLi_00185 [Colletotrichum liriopes]